MNSEPRWAQGENPVVPNAPESIGITSAELFTSGNLREKTMKTIHNYLLTCLSIYRKRSMRKNNEDNP